MIPRVATAYDQNPARMALLLKERRKKARKMHPTLYRIVVSIGLMAHYVANHIPG